MPTSSYYDTVSVCATLDANNNTYVGEDKDGTLYMRFPDYNSEEAWDIYFELNPWAQDEMEFIDGQWTWE